MNELLSQDQSFMDSIMFTNINKKLNQAQHEDEIVINEKSISFASVDPLTMQKIDYPARGFHCEHLDAFDLKTCLLNQKKERNWACPICHKQLRCIYIDNEFRNILQSLPTDPSDDLSDDLSDDG